MTNVTEMIEFGQGWIFVIGGRSYRTDRNGEGLWFQDSGGNESQCRGCAQFSLSHHRGAALRKIKKTFQD